jgi:hypothetical protein
MSWFRLVTFAGALALTELPAGQSSAAALDSSALSSNRANSALLIVPPLPSPPKAPVEFFRELLAMNSAERIVALTNRTLEDRKGILAKVREYQALKPDQRDLRLQATELSWYMSRLMRMAPTNRAAQLAVIPDPTRQRVQDRLAVWDRLTPEARKEFLEKQAALKALVERAAGITQPANTKISPQRAVALEKGIREIQAMPEEQRSRLMTRFNDFFDLTSQEQKRALNTLSEPERLQMEKTLRAFGQLTPAQRNRCIRSFEKFAELSLEERNQFLKNAEQWKAMKPAERQAWREVVSQVPILPTGFGSPPIPKPAGPRRLGPPVATNGN